MRKLFVNGASHIPKNWSGKSVTIKNIEGPEGVRGRNSDNTLLEEKIGWAPSESLRDGMEKTYKWIAEQVKKEKEPVNYVYDDGVVSTRTIR